MCGRLCGWVSCLRKACELASGRGRGYRRGGNYRGVLDKVTVTIATIGRAWY